MEGGYRWLWRQKKPIKFIFWDKCVCNNIWPREVESRELANLKDGITRSWYGALFILQIKCHIVYLVDCFGSICFWREVHRWILFQVKRLRIFRRKCCRQTSVGICHFKTTPRLGDYSGAPNVNFRKITVRTTIWELELSKHLCKISCLPSSPRIFEHLKNGIIAHF